MSQEVDKKIHEVVRKPRRRWPAFVVVASILLVAAVGLQYAVAAFELHFQKLPVPLEQPLVTGIPREIGPWVFVGVDEPMSHAVEEALGTEEYIQRNYVDSRKVDPALLEDLGSKSGEELFLVIQQARQADPSSVVTLHMAYYTGGVDTVPHIPDRCMVAGGFQPEGDDTVTLPGLVEGEPLTMRSVSFVDTADQSRQQVRLNVMYAFQVNGHYAHDPITGVRQELAKLTSKYGYFCKIELMSIQPDRQAGVAAMSDFLTSAMPVIEAALPDYDAFLARQAEADKTAAAADDGKADDRS